VGQLWFEVLLTVLVFTCQRGRDLVPKLTQTRTHEAQAREANKKGEREEQQAAPQRIKGSRSEIKKAVPASFAQYPSKVT